jgi:cell division protein FtsB
MSAYFDLSCDIQRHDRRNRADIEALQEQVALQAAKIEALEAHNALLQKGIAALKSYFFAPD